MIAVYIFGLEKGIYQGCSPREKLKFLAAALFYFFYCLLALISGYSFFNLITSSWKLGLLGALIFFTVFGVLHHVILNTIKNNPEETKPKSWKRFLPNSGQVFRLAYSVFFALILSFPFTALVSPGLVKSANGSAERKVEDRIAGISTSPVFNNSIQIYGANNRNHTAAIFGFLATSPQLYLVFLLILGVAIYPAILLSRLKSGDYYIEFDQRKNKLILSNYTQLVESVTNEHACAVAPDQQELLEKLKVLSHPSYKREESKIHDEYSEEAYKRILRV